MNLPRVEDLSPSTHTAADDGDDSYRDDAVTSDEGGEYRSDANLASSNQVTRDALLLKCRDAIENLHIEIEEERNQKAHL